MLALTARTPTGSIRREDVADRSLLFQLETLPAKRPEFAIQEEVARLRDELMSDYAGMVQRALRVPLDTVKVADPEVRMADFALVATRIGESMGQEIRDLTDETISLIRPAQHKFATEENFLSTLLDIWITRSNGAISNNGRPVPTQELLDDFRQIAKERDLKFKIQSPVALGIRLGNIVPALSEKFEIIRDRSSTSKTWTFWRIETFEDAEAQS